MKEINVNLSEMRSVKLDIGGKICARSYKNRKRKTIKERLNFGIMYQHPKLYIFAIWMNDPNQLIPKTLAKSVEGNSVLDLGCGTGTFQKFLPNNINYIGIDLNEDFLVYAEKKGKGAFYKRDILNDLSEFKADTVILSDVLHHVTPNHQKLLDNAIAWANKKVVISACYEKEEGPFKQLSEFIGRRIIDNDGLNEQREGAGWLRLAELISFLRSNGASNFQKVLSHIHCEIKV
ncbi:MAG: class I SAM-dependent methyltransferase [Candidatus Heimdallarchaeota archaeon]